MKAFLKNLVSRSLGSMPVVQPRVPSLFEPPIAYSGSFGETYELDMVAETSSPHTPLPAKEGRTLLASEPQSKEAGRIRLPEHRADTSPSPAQDPGTHPAALLPETVSRTRVREGRSLPPFELPSKEAERLWLPERRAQAPTSPLLPEDSAVHGASLPAPGILPQRLAFESAPPGPARLAFQSSERTMREAVQPNRKPRDPLTAARPRVNARSDPFSDPFDEAHQPAEPATMAGRAMASQQATGKPPGRLYTPVESQAIQRFDFRRHIPPPYRRSTEPAVEVTIGRIEVRAVSAQNSRRRESSASPVMSLNDYLRQRSKRGDA